MRMRDAHTHTLAHTHTYTHTMAKVKAEIVGVHTNEYFSTGWLSDRSTQLQTEATQQHKERPEYTTYCASNSVSAQVVLNCNPQLHLSSCKGPSICLTLSK